MRLIIQFFRDERGTTAIEYSMIGVAVSIVIIAGARLIGTNINSLFYGKIGNALS